MEIKVNQLPQKIKDGCLLDAMVNLHFKTELVQSVIEKAIEEKLNSLIGVGLFSKIPVIDNGEMLKGRTFFANDIYRIMVVSDTLSFNIVKGYPTWSPYKSFVRDLISALLDKITITNVDVRYMSHFGNIPLFENIDGIIKLNQLQAFQGARYTFQCFVNDGVPGRIPAQATVNLTDRQQVVPGRLESIVDISVSSEVNGIAVDDIIRALDFVHICEKHLFFTIISEGFYQQLKVE